MMSVLISYFRTPRVQVAALIYFLIAGALTQAPLFNYLGYEFSALMTIPAAFISGILSIKFMREHRMKPLTRRTWLYVLSDYLTVNFLLLLVPFAVISLNALAVKNCAFGTGSVYYLLLTVGGMVFSVSLSLVIGALFRNGILIYCAAVLGILSHILFITLTQPQLFAFNFILGFFPGITYDETLTDLTPIILYREFTVIASLMLFAGFIIIVGSFLSTDTFRKNLLALKSRIRHDRSLWGVVIFCAAILGAAHLFRAELGFEYSESDIRNALGRRSESDHFILYYQAEDHTADEIRILKAECEFHFRIISDFLHLSKKEQGKIDVYLYPTAEWKQRYIGTANTNIAKPWKREIHLTTGTFGSTFRHELVHILASEFGFPLINASLRMGLNEGLAVAADWDEGLFTPNEYAAALKRDGKLDRIQRLFTYSGFAAQSSSYAYLVTGSFSRYLIERFGIERFKTAFPNGNFVAAFGGTLESLLKDWNAYLSTVDCSSVPTETVTTIFTQPSIFFKTCAREVASQNQRGAAALRKKDYRSAEWEFSQAYHNAQTAGALRGLMQVLIAQDRPAEALRLFDELPSGSLLKKNPSIRLLTADALYLTARFDSARFWYSSVEQMRISEPFIETSLLRRQFISDSIPVLSFHRLLYGGMTDTARIALIDSMIRSGTDGVSLRYLKAILLPQHDPSAMSAFADIPATDGLLQYFIARRSADVHYARGAFEEAKIRYWDSKNRAPSSAAANAIDERIELCDFVLLELQ